MPLSGFSPAVRRWFEGRFGEPTGPQREGWPLIREGRNTLIAAPTGSGKTLAAFLWAVDGLLSRGPDLPDETVVLYVSPLKALANDVRLNLTAPLEEIRALDPALPEVRVLVRSGDTLPSARAAMTRRPPHILVTTPESLYIMLTSAGGRRMLATVRTVIVDEIHAVAGTRRGAHLALSLERLEALTAQPRPGASLEGESGGSGSQESDSTARAISKGSSKGRVVSPSESQIEMQFDAEADGGLPLSTNSGGVGAAGSSGGPQAGQGSGLGSDAAASGRSSGHVLMVGGSLPQGPPGRASTVWAGLQRIGLSATQKPVENVGRLLVGSGRDCSIVDTGHRRDMDLAVEIPESPLETVCSHETWDEIFSRMAALIQEHRSTLLFVNTRKMAERVAARLAGLLGSDAVTSHHGSLSRERRLDAERRLKAGELRALVATASLELGIDIGDVDLVIQAGVTPSIAVFLQRVGRAGHGPERTPKGRIFPLTQDDLACAAALMHAVRRGELDRTPESAGSLDILAQQIVAECVGGPWDEAALFESFRRAWPYRDLPRSDFDDAVALHTGGRAALLHRDGVRGRLRATKRARLTALTSGGAIPDTADYRVLLQPDETLVGTLNEDFAIEANVGDIFQLGNLSWQILKVEPGVVRVADARGAPPTIPFWLGEGPSRTEELCEALSVVRERGAASEASEHAEGEAHGFVSSDSNAGAAWLREECGLGEGAAAQLSAFLSEGARALGAVPTRRRVVAERFFDESGGMQLVIHSPFGGRLNRAWGLALRKRFCRSFGFELQAAANEEAILLSLGPQHSFPLREVFDYLRPETARDVLVQAVLPSPLFTTRWRWNVVRSLVLSKTRGGGQRVPAALLRMRAEDLLVGAFPEMLACGETLPPGDLPVPWENPLVRQTIEDCLHEAMDVEGFLGLLRDLRERRIEIVAVDTPAPSSFARGILNAMPWAFLDDAPLEERRARAVASRRGLEARLADGVGALDPEAVARVREEAWPQPENEEEVHEALGWMGYVTEEEARRSGWTGWIESLHAAGRVRSEIDPALGAPAPGEGELPVELTAERIESPPGSRQLARGAAPSHARQIAGSGGVEARAAADASARDRGIRWYAAETVLDPVGLLRGRLEALGPVVVGEEAEQGLPAEHVGRIALLESQGVVLRCRIGGREAWCERRLLARIQSYTLDRLRKEISPVSASDMWRFLAAWQHVDPERRVDGPEGVAQVLRQLAGFEVPAGAWESTVLPARVRGYRPEWLDRILLTGEWVWLRLWGEGATVPRTTPLSLVPAADLDTWLALRPPREAVGVDSGPGTHEGSSTPPWQREDPAAPARATASDGGLSPEREAVVNPRVTAGPGSVTGVTSGQPGGSSSPPLPQTVEPLGNDAGSSFPPAHSRPISGIGSNPEARRHTSPGSAPVANTEGGHAGSFGHGVASEPIRGSGSTSSRNPPVDQAAGSRHGQLAETAGNPAGGTSTLSTHGAALLAVLERRGALFTRDLVREAGPLSEHVDMGLAELIARGRITCDSFGGMRRLIKPRRGRDPESRRPRGARPPDVRPAGRWSVIPEVERSPDRSSSSIPQGPDPGRRRMTDDSSAGRGGVATTPLGASRQRRADHPGDRSQAVTISSSPAPHQVGPVGESDRGAWDRWGDSKVRAGSSPSPVDRRPTSDAPAGPRSTRGADRRPVVPDREPPEQLVEFVARQLLRRYGVVFRRLIERERIPVAWRYLVRSMRRMELRGEIRGGRFVASFAGEQFALPEAIPLLREVRRNRESLDPAREAAPGRGDPPEWPARALDRGRSAPAREAAPGREVGAAERRGSDPEREGRDPEREGSDPNRLEAPLHVSAADPLNLVGILTPDERVASLARRRVPVAPR